MLKKIIFGKPISKNQKPHFNYFKKKKYIFDLNELNKLFYKKINSIKKYLNLDLLINNNDIIMKSITNPIFDKENKRIYLENFNSRYLSSLFSMQSNNFRKYYKNTKKFTYKKHIEHFNKIKLKKNIQFLIIKLEDAFCGYVKTEDINKKSIISIGIRKKFQGKGIGTEVLRFLKLHNYFKNIPTAHINKMNTASLIAFKNANIKNVQKF